MENVRQVFARVIQRTAVQLADREEIELQRSDDAEVALAATHGPEEFWIIVGGDLPQPSICRHHVE
jgi:hypothetical protein